MVAKAPLGRVMDTDIRLLRVFRTVVEFAGISASELELGIGRSTISRHISDLEVRLGVKLCKRGRSGFALTEEGEQILAATDELFASLQLFQRRVADTHKTLSGNLKLAFFDHTATNPASHLSAAISDFDQIAPAVSLQLSIEPPNVIEAGVVSGRFDIGIVPMHKASSLLQYSELYSESMLLYCGQGHPLFGLNDEVRERRAIKTSKYAGLSFNSPNMIVGQRKKLVRSAEVQDEDALGILILSGRYLGFLPNHAAKEFVDQGKMRAVGGKYYSYLSSHAAITRRFQEPSRVVSMFLSCLKSAHSVGTESRDKQGQ